MQRVLGKLSLERGLLLGAAIGVAGVVGLVVSLVYWRGQKFGQLDYEHALRLMIPSVTALIVSSQVILGTFFLSILGIKHTRHPVTESPPTVRGSAGQGGTTPLTPPEGVNRREQPAAAPRL